MYEVWPLSSETVKLLPPSLRCCSLSFLHCPFGSLPSIYFSEGSLLLMSSERLKLTAHEDLMCLDVFMRVFCF